MKTTIRKSVKLIITALITVTMTLGAATSPVSAASTPSKVSLSSVSATYSYVTVKWKKASYATGYQVYRNGAKLGNTSNLSFKNTSVKQGAKYSYKVRAYRKYTVKQYYNSKTKKWQSKKPPKRRWKGKRTRKVAKYNYGKFSSTKTITVSVKPEEDELEPASTEEMAEDGSHMHKWVPQYATREAIDYYTAEDVYSTVIVCVCGTRNVSKEHIKAHISAGEPCNTHNEYVVTGTTQTPHYKTEKYVTEYICSVCNGHKEAGHTHVWEEVYNTREEIIGYNPEKVATGRIKHTCTACGHVIYTDANGMVIKPDGESYNESDYDLNSPEHTYVSEPEYTEQQVPITTTVRCLKELKCACGETKQIESISDNDTKWICNTCGHVSYTVEAAREHQKAH